MENWEEKSNSEIMAAQLQMNEEFNAKKRELIFLYKKANKLTEDLNKLDVEYLNSKKVIDSRLNYGK